MNSEQLAADWQKRKDSNYAMASEATERAWEFVMKKFPAMDEQAKASLAAAYVNAFSVGLLTDELNQKLDDISYEIRQNS
jgi:hypothetical protein